jgi:uncharacterized protein YkwD
VRGGVLAGLAGGVAILALTMPAAAFNSGTDSDTYYGDQIGAVNLHRVWLAQEGRAYESVDGFTRRMPDDEFDNQILQLVNRFRDENGLPPAQHYEPLRAQSAMWANRMADDDNGYLNDSWYAADARVACHQLDDIATVSSFTVGTAQDVFDQWLTDPAVVTGMLMPDPAYLGAATVEESGKRWITMRIAQGACPGEPNRLTGPVVDLPTPLLKTVYDASGTLRVRIKRPGSSQLNMEVQSFNGATWSLFRNLFAEPNHRVTVTGLPQGQYRVVVPSQAGYAVAISPNITVP